MVTIFQVRTECVGNVSLSRILARFITLHDQCLHTGKITANYHAHKVIKVKNNVNNALSAFLPAREVVKK